MNILKNDVPHWLASMTVGLVLATGCVPGRTLPSTNPSPSGIFVEAAFADEVLTCAEQQFRIAGYATHRDANTPLVIRADRETTTSGSAYELNVARAALVSIDTTPGVFRFLVSAETREFPSRDITAGYTVRLSPRGDVLQVTEGVKSACARRSE